MVSNSIPSLILNIGKRYRFVYVSNESKNAAECEYPFYISYSKIGAGKENTGLVPTLCPGQSAEVIITGKWTTGRPLYFQSKNHEYMGGPISIRQ